jgi:hypothetical protein
MSIIKWGKYTLEIAPLTGSTIGAFQAIQTPVDGSFALNVEEGDKKEAFIEGGERIDVKKSANKYSFEFEVYIGAGLPKPIQDNDGIITGEYAIRLIPEDASLEGFLMKRASVSVTESFTSADGHKAKYTFESLKPASGKMLEPYTAPVE